MDELTKGKTENRELPHFAAWRAYRGLEQSDVAKMLETTQASISRWERFETEPSIDKLRELARVYRVTIDDLINRTPFEPSAAMQIYLDLKDAPERIQKRALKLVQALLHDHQEEE